MSRSESSTTERILDVREIEHRFRHTVIFQIFGSLGPGEAFQIVNDHDPKPLRHLFEAQFGDAVGWAYLEQGPDLWRVRIGRSGA